MHATLRCKGRFLSLAALVSALSGCEVLDNIHIEDKNTRDYAASVVVRPVSMRFRDGRGGRGGFELAYEHHHGNGLQNVDAGHYVSFDGQRISGPINIDNRADSKHWDLSYNQLFSFGRYFELEPSAGLSYDITDAYSLSTTAPIRSIALNERNWGFNIMATPRFKINEYVAIEARLRTSIETDNSHSETLFTSLVLNPTPSIALHIGYMEYSHDLRLPDYTSDVQLRFAGPSAALRLAFK